MSVSAAAQRNSHFVTELDLHQDARGSRSCRLRELAELPLFQHQSPNRERGGGGMFWHLGFRFVSSPPQNPDF